MNWWRRPYVWALASAAAVLIANVGGLAIGDDGVGYEAIADNLLSGKGLGYFLEPELTIWPPGWPLLMALIARITPLDAGGAAIVLNAATAFAVVMLTNRLLDRLVARDDLVTMGTAVAALGASSMVFGHLLMTDFAFAAITLALFLALINYRRSDSVGWLAASVALVWAGFMIRYAGIVHIGTGAIWFLVDRRFTVWARVRSAALFAIAAAVVPALWIIRNLSTDHTALGVRYSSARGLLGNAFDLVATIGNFLTPGVAIEIRTLWAAIALLGIGAVAVFAWRVVRARPHLWSFGGWIDLAAGALGLLAIHIVVYLAYMLYARTTTGLNRLDFRLLNPVYLPLMIIGIVVIDRVSALDAPEGRRVWQRASITAAWTWAALNIALGVGMVAYFATSPDLFVGNYDRPAFDEARQSDALDAIPPGCRVSSNLPNALYDAGIEAQWSPRNTGLESDDPVDDLDQMDAALARHDYCLVWIDLEPRYGHLATLEELEQRFDLDELASDGVVTVYRIQPA